MTIVIFSAMKIEISSRKSCGIFLQSVEENWEMSHFYERSQKELHYLKIVGKIGEISKVCVCIITFCILLSKEKKNRN